MSTYINNPYLHKRSALIWIIKQHRTMTMTTAQQPQAKAAIATQQVAFSDLKNVTLGTAISSLNAVNNAARLIEHTTGILADKAERYREQVTIADAITHNQLMADYNKQAQELGLDF